MTTDERRRYALSCAAATLHAEAHDLEAEAAGLIGDRESRSVHRDAAATHRESAQVFARLAAEVGPVEGQENRI
jgi:hypothetical protein